MKSFALLDGILYWLIEPSAKLMQEWDCFPGGAFVMCKYRRAYRYAVYAILRLPSYRYMADISRDCYCWHRAHFVWCSEIGFEVRWLVEY